MLLRLVRLGGLAGEVGHAALALLRAETELARAAVPHATAWLCVAVAFAVLLVASLWGALVYAVYQWTGSFGAALAWVGGGAAAAFGLAVWLLVRAVRALSYAQTRRRIAAWLESGRDGDETEPRKE